MSLFSFWYGIERLCYRIAGYCKRKRDEAFDRDLEKSVEKR